MIEKIKKVDFLSPDANINHDYKLIKTNKKDFNVSKKQLNETSNTRVVDYFINPLNRFDDNFGSRKYIDFQLPKNDLLYYQFLLKFNLKAENVISANNQTYNTELTTTTNSNTTDNKNLYVSGDNNKIKIENYINHMFNIKFTNYNDGNDTPFSMLAGLYTITEFVSHLNLIGKTFYTVSLNSDGYLDIVGSGSYIIKSINFNYSSSILYKVVNAPQNEVSVVNNKYTTGKVVYNYYLDPNATNTTSTTLISDNVYNNGFTIIKGSSFKVKYSNESSYITYYIPEGDYTLDGLLTVLNNITYKFSFSCPNNQFVVSFLPLPTNYINFGITDIYKIFNANSTEYVVGGVNQYLGAPKYNSLLDVNFIASQTSLIDKFQITNLNNNFMDDR